MVLGNLGISWTAGAVNCVLCALNSPTINFKRVDPQWFRAVRKGQLARRGCCSVGTGAARHRITLRIGCQWHQFIIQLCVCISASPFRGPPDLTQLRRVQRREAARPRQHIRALTCPPHLGASLHESSSKMGRPDTSLVKDGFLSWGKVVVWLGVMALQQGTKNWSKTLTRFVAERPEDWRMETACNVTQLTPPMHTHAIIHGYTTCMRSVQAGQIPPKTAPEDPFFC